MFLFMSHDVCTTIDEWGEEGPYRDATIMLFPFYGTFSSDRLPQPLKNLHVQRKSLTVCLAGSNSWWTTPSLSKNAISITFVLDLSWVDFFCRREDVVCHFNDCVFFFNACVYPNLVTSNNCLNKCRVLCSLAAINFEISIRSEFGNRKKHISFSNHLIGLREWIHEKSLFLWQPAGDHFFVSWHWRSRLLFSGDSNIPEILKTTCQRLFSLKNCCKESRTVCIILKQISPTSLVFLCLVELRHHDKLITTHSYIQLHCRHSVCY